MQRTLIAVGLLAAFLMASLAGCLGTRPSTGGAGGTFTGPRQLNPKDIALPPGYRIEAIASGLTFPTGVAFDDQGRLHVVEAGYSYGEKWTQPRLLRVSDDAAPTPVATGGRNGPWNGVVFAKGAFFVAEGGQLEGGRILRITPDGKSTAIVDNLPSQGDHHTNGPAIGPDGAVYFGQGTVTNSGVVGPDNYQMGWLKRHPGLHDTPGQDITLAGVNYDSPNPMRPGEKTSTGAFVPFGTSTRPGQVVKGQVPCNGAIMKVPADGGKVELVAWGLRNPFGLAFAPDGRLFATDNSYDVRGSRPVFGTGDLLWRVEPGRWYGWPDYHGPLPVDSGDHFQPPSKPKPQRLLAQDPGQPPQPIAYLGVHSSSNGLDFSRSDRFGHVGQAFIAQFGDQSPMTGKLFRPVGFKVVRVNTQNGVIEDFAVNRGVQNGPASLLKTGGLERPIAVRFAPDGQSLYVVDFGVLTIHGKEMNPREKTGVLWRISRVWGDEK